MTADGDGSINSGAGGGAARDSSSGDQGGGGLGDALSCSVVRCVEAHSKGGMSCMVAHPTAPLLASGTSTQVVKVWTDAGDAVSGGGGAASRATAAAQGAAGLLLCARTRACARARLHAHPPVFVCLSAAPPAQVGAIRTQSPYSQHKMGPVTCMAWHPYNLYLGAAGNDSVASVYIVDNVVTSAAPSGVSYAPTSISSLGLGGGHAAG